MLTRRGKLGEGTYGVVYDATTPRGSNCAVKRNLTGVETGRFIGSVRELHILNEVNRHPYLVGTKYVYLGQPFPSSCMSPIFGKRDREGQQDDSLHFVFEKANLDLHTFIHRRTPDYSLIAKFMVQMALGLEFLHSRDIIHRDLKPNNFLIFDDVPDEWGGKGVAKICDFGLAKPHTYQGFQTPEVITAWYRAPEVALGNPKYDGKVDIWSLGCVFFEMIARRALFAEIPDNNDIVISRILGKLPIPLSSEDFNKFIVCNPYRKINLTRFVSPRNRSSFAEQIWPNAVERQKNVALFNSQLEHGAFESLCDLITKMLTFDPLKRPTITQVLQEPFFYRFQGLISNIRMQASKLPISTNLIHVSPCIEREWGMSLARDIYAKRHIFTSWYSDRTLFQGMDLYDRYISTITNTIKPHPTAVESSDRGRYHTRMEAELRFIVCIYIAIKYFSSVQAPVSYNVIANESFRTETAIKQAEQFEINFIQNCLQYRVYRPTIYEQADKMGLILTPEQIGDLVHLYIAGQDINGKTPKQVLERYLFSQRLQQGEIVPHVPLQTSIHVRQPTPTFKVPPVSPHVQGSGHVPRVPISHNKHHGTQMNQAPHGTQSFHVPPIPPQFHFPYIRT